MFIHVDSYVVLSYAYFAFVSAELCFSWKHCLLFIVNETGWKIKLLRIECVGVELVEELQNGFVFKCKTERLW